MRPYSSFRHVGMQHEVIEAAGRLDAGDLPDGDGDHRADVVEVRFLSHGAQRRDGQVRAVQRLEHQGSRADFQLIVVVPDEVRPGRPTRSRVRTVAPSWRNVDDAPSSRSEHGAVPDDRHEALSPDYE